jgi:N-acetylglucosaminyl-diphospho-decaprenol L-rhamnosyltransferase
VQPALSVSIVSHRQGELARALLGDLARLDLPLEVLLTVNVPEPEIVPDGTKVRIIRNAAPRGFGANHNAAFQCAAGEYFCVMNPDVRMPNDVFSALLGHLRADPQLGAVAPKVVDPAGAVEDSARAFPTAASLLLKAFGVDRHPPENAHPDWIAGMFMLFPRRAFEQAGGFDTSYFLYYEDVDLCARLRKLGYRVAYCTEVSVVHDARRTSRRNPRYLVWHLSSMARFLGRRALGRL